MEPFIFKNPTKLIFGKGQLTSLKEEVPEYGRKILLVYGGGSIKRSGLYGQVIQLLRESNAEIFELSGVESNPRLSTVKKGIDICKVEKVELILAVGGGSVIDCSKTIAAGVKYDGDVWDLVTKKATAVEALPLGTVLTIAATGSEMNPSAVITDWEANEKIAWGSPLLLPKFSILDPEITYTVPKDQTINGIVDMMSHVFEQYFHQTPNTPLQDRMCEAVLKTVIEAGSKLVNDLQNYELRETILYSGTIALNGFLQMGVQGDWATHAIEHAVSAVYDIPHGGGLAILTPNWMLHVVDGNIEKFRQFAVRVFDVEPDGKTDRQIAVEGIERLRAFWTSIGAPSRLADYDIDDSKLELMADHALTAKGGEFGTIKKLNKSNILEILTMSL